MGALRALLKPTALQNLPTPLAQIDQGYLFPRGVNGEMDPAFSGLCNLVATQAYPHHVSNENHLLSLAQIPSPRTEEGYYNGMSSVTKSLTWEESERQALAPSRN